MNKLLWKCPVCEQQLHVTSLECGSCGSELRGHFEIGRLARLGGDELYFVEIFVKNRGNAYRVAEELEIPYSSVRARLTEIIQALGYDDENEAGPDAPMPSEERKAILEQVSNGKLSTEQAVKMLQGEE